MQCQVFECNLKTLQKLTNSQELTCKTLFLSRSSLCISSSHCPFPLGAPSRCLAGNAVRSFCRCVWHRKNVFTGSLRCFRGTLVTLELGCQLGRPRDWTCFDQFKNDQIIFKQSLKIIQRFYSTDQSESTLRPENREAAASEFLWPASPHCFFSFNMFQHLRQISSSPVCRSILCACVCGKSSHISI